MCILVIVNSEFLRSFGKFWNVMEIDNTIFEDLESFGKGIFFKMAVEKFWIFVWEYSKTS